MKSFRFVLLGLIGVGLLAVASTSLSRAQTPPDGDGDGVPDSEDNCPAWYNPDQSLPSFPRYTTVDDPDCDGWNTADEEFMGTDPLKQCADTPLANDEPLPDAWPADFDDDQWVTILDIIKFVPPCFIEPYGILCGQYIERFDLNADGRINILDIVLMTPPMFNSTCAA